MYDFEVKGYPVTIPRQPSSDEMSTVLSNVRRDREVSHDAAKAFLKALLPREDFERLALKRSAGFQSLAVLVLETFGFGATVTLLEEYELDGEVADAYAKEDGKSRELYPDEDDERGKLYPIAFEVDGAERFAILRYPKEREVAATRKAKSIGSMKDFIRRICVWGSLDGIDETAPALWFMLCEFAMDQAGDGEARRLGK